MGWRDGEEAVGEDVICRGGKDGGEEGSQQEEGEVHLS